MNDLIDDWISKEAKRVTTRQVKAGARTYSRRVHLPKLGIDPKLGTDDIVARLQNAFRVAKYGMAKGTSDMNKVLAIRQALVAERHYYSTR